MKKTMKKILCSLLVAVICLTAAPLQGFVDFNWSWLDFSVKASALAKTGQCGENVFWNYDSSTGELVISGSGAIENYTPYDSPFYESNIKSVVISGDITTIGDEAFYCCKSLQSVTISDSVTIIGEKAFASCHNLQSVTIPDSVTIIGEKAFASCDNLQSVTFGNSVTTIGASAFQSCEILQNVTIPTSVTYIGDFAFYYCYGIQQVTIPDSVTTIGQYAFSHCNNLQSVTISSGLTIIGTGMLYYCESLQNVTIPDSVTTISYRVFGRCPKLTDVYYTGTQTQWQKINVGSENESLKSAKITYNYVIEGDGEVDDNENVGDNDNSESNEPDGYDFYEDSYSFENYSTVLGLSKKYFTTIYEEGPGKQLHKKKKNVSNEGLCFGMAYTTAAIYNGLPAATSVINENIFTADQYRNIIREIKKSDKLYIRDLKISIDDYIKYAFIYQWAQESVWDLDLNGYIDGTLESDMLSTVLALYRNDDTGHAVLLTGYEVENDGSIIYYVDDPNSTDALETIEISTDGSWEFSNPWNGTVDSTNSVLGAYVDVYAPYRILLTGDRATVKESIDLNDTVTTETYIENMKRVNSDKVLLYIDSDSFDVDCENMYEVGAVDYTGINDGTEDRGSFYWVNSDKTVTVSNILSDSNEISLSGDNTIITANVAENSTLTMTIDDNDIDANIETEIGKECSLSFETIVEDEEYNNIETIVTITGIASNDKINATQTETGLIITGIEDGTITLAKDDEVIVTHTINGAESDIEITYDKNGESDSLEVEYETHEHTYNSVVTKEATCTESGVKTFDCICGDTYTETLDANGHSDSEWIIDSDATCSADGLKHIECTVCEATIKTELIAKLPHNYNSVVTEATCEKDGYTIYTCDCGDTYTGDKTPAKGHDYAEVVCKNCGDSKVDNCSCNCHKSGFMGFIWKILRFFYKLFGTNKTCDCGVTHY